MKIPSILLIIGIAATLLSIGCASGDTKASDGDFKSGAAFGPGMDAGGMAAANQRWTGSGGMNGADPSAVAGAMAPQDIVVPETEKLIGFEQPQAGNRFVFIANPETDKVFIIDADNYSVKSTTHDRPTYLKSVPTSKDEPDTVIVLNVPSAQQSDKEENAEVIRARPNQEPTEAPLKVVRNSNVIAVSPEGKYAVVYFDPRYSRVSQSSRSYQEVTLISLEEGNDRSKNLTVGFSPSAVYFSNDGSRGFVVTEDGVSILDFAEIEKPGAGVAETVSLGYTFNEIPSDISVTADGKYALARLEGSPEVHLVDLETKSIKALNLASSEIGTPSTEGDGEDGGVDPQIPHGQVTDLKLSNSGEFAVAVLRDMSTVLKIPIPQGFDDPSLIESTQIENVIIGVSALSPNDHYALLYTTAVYDERITIINLEDKEEEPRTVQLRKNIEAVAIAPDNISALIVHDRAESAIDEIDRSWGYSILNLEEAFAKLQVTETRLSPFVITPNHLFILFRDDALSIKEVHRVSLTGLQVDVFGLERPPYSIGSIEQSKRIFVAQEQSGGLITLMDWEGDVREDISGFDRQSDIHYMGEEYE